MHKYVLAVFIEPILPTELTGFLPILVWRKVMYKVTWLITEVAWMCTYCSQIQNVPKSVCMMSMFSFYKLMLVCPKQIQNTFHIDYDKINLNVYKTSHSVLIFWFFYWDSPIVCDWTKYLQRQFISFCTQHALENE